jgi:hypothetical protein
VPSNGLKVYRIFTIGLLAVKIPCPPTEAHALLLARSKAKLS